MSCDAIATATARVPLDLPESLAKVLDDQSAQIVIGAHLKSVYGEVSIYSGSPTLGGSPTRFATSSVIVSYQAGQVTVTSRDYSMGTYENQRAAQALAQDLTQVLKQAAGFLLQEQVTQALAGFAQIEGSQITSNGARVITINL